MISLAGALQGQAPEDFTGEDRPQVQVAPVATVRVQAGKSATSRLDFRVRPKFHINSHTPTSDLLMPTVLSLDPPTNVSVGRISYPEGKQFQFSFAPGESLSVYSGDFSVTAQLLAAQNTPPGTYRVRGELQYQACDNHACYPPGKLPVLFKVTVTRPPGTGPARRNPRQSPHAR